MKNAHPFMQGNTLWRPIFSALPHDVLFLKKSTVYWPIEHPDKVALLDKGLLKVFIADANGEERFMWIIEQNTLIQYNNHAFTHSLAAIEDSKLLLVDRKPFTAAIRQDDVLFDAYIQSIYQKYVYCIEKLVVNDVHNAKFKVYSFLLHLACRYGTPPPDAQPGVIIENILSRRDISSITGVHRTNIIKFLADLERLELIERLPSAIHIKDLPALEQLVRSLDIS